MKTARIFFLILAMLLAGGCGTNPYARKFDADADDVKIRQAVIAAMLERHFWDDGDFSAIFLSGSDAEVEAMIRKVGNHVPPIKSSYRAELRPNKSPLDKDTGKSAIILSADATDPEGDVVEAVGRWYAGEVVSGVRTFSLRKTGGEWVVESIR